MVALREMTLKNDYNIYLKNEWIFLKRGYSAT